MNAATLFTLDAARRDAATVARCLAEAAHAHDAQVAYWLAEAHAAALNLVGRVEYARSAP